MSLSAARLDRDGLHRSRSRSQTRHPGRRPDRRRSRRRPESAWRPRTKCWWSSSVAAYAIPTASASGSPAERLGRAARRERRTRSGARPCAGSVSHVPSPVERLGIEESAKITRRPDEHGKPDGEDVAIWPSAPDAESPATNRRAARESGASPERSRRCKGRRSRATMPLAHGLGRRRGREPRVRRPPPPAKPNPSRKEDSCLTDSSPSLAASSLRCSSCPAAFAVKRARPCGRQGYGRSSSDGTADRRHVAARECSAGERPRRARVGERARRVLLPRDVDQSSARTSTRSGRYAGRRTDRLGVQGQRRVAARWRGPGAPRRTVTPCSGTGRSSESPGGPQNASF